ncbi:MAG: hypothetical protein FWF24_02385 [Alphaproteobacteria bacterium]|nr:hypothetical protein [Alphaproteobacteria bacterium]
MSKNLDIMPMTDRALKRLRALAKGNAMEPDSIRLIESKEQIYTLNGTLTLTPQFDIQTKQVVGRVKGKGVRLHNSVEALQQEVLLLQRQFSEGTGWVNEAIKELETIKGHGWGQEEAFLTWEGQEKEMHLAASENCTTCGGGGRVPCIGCQGQGRSFCYTCQASGSETCIRCLGTGMEADHAQPCTLCHGRRLSPCRFCRGSGKMICPKCQGQAKIPCVQCKAAGVFSQEVHIKQGALLNFSLDSTAHVPSGLLRALSRFKDGQFEQGDHADITMFIDEDEKNKKTKDHLLIQLKAEIPYAEMKIRFGHRAALVGSFGKKGILSGVPPFLDEALSNTLTDLRGAARGKISLAQAAKVRIVHDALDLVLEKKKASHDLRRLYPLGLTAKTAQEIMSNTIEAVKKDTAATRSFVGAAGILVSTGLFAFMFMTPAFEKLAAIAPPLSGIVVLIVMPAFLMALIWQSLHIASRAILAHKYPKAHVSFSQNIGTIGHTTLGIMIALYVLTLYFTGHLF